MLKINILLEKEKENLYYYENKEVEKKQKLKEVLILLKDLPNGSFYFFAVDKRDNQADRYVNPDPKSKMIKLNTDHLEKRI